MNIQTLIDLDEDEFLDELNENVGFSSKDWPQFLQPEVVHRTVDALDELLTKVTMQLTTHEGQDRGDGWERKARNFKSLIEMRLRKAKHTAHASEASGDRSRAWRACLHEVAEALEDSDLSGELDDITIPFDGLTVRTWLERRRAKREAGAA